MLSKDELRVLACPTDISGTYHFDLSTVPVDKNEQLFKSLLKFAQTNVISIGFNTDTLRKLERKNATGGGIPTQVINSIAGKKQRYVRNVIELLCYLMNKRTFIKEIVLSSLQIRPESINKLAVALSQCQSLESVVFKYVPLQDESFATILNNLDPNRLKSVTFYGCNLSKDAINSVLSFLARRTDPNGIEDFKVSKLEFSETDRNKIADALSKVSQSSQVAQSLTPPQQIKNRSPPRNPQEAELERLKYENSSLKEQLRILRESVDAVQYSENIFIVGKNAEEFVKFLGTVEAKIARLEEKKAALSN